LEFGIEKFSIEKGKTRIDIAENVIKIAVKFWR